MICKVIIMITIKKITDKKQKKYIIEKCDNAFEFGIVNRDDYKKILIKIISYAEFFAAYYEDKAVGYAAVYANNNETQCAFISMLGVLPEMQGKSIGTQLMEACINESYLKNMKLIRLEVNNNNSRAIKFYNSFGFVIEKKRGIQSTYMIKSL